MLKIIEILIFFIAGFMISISIQKYRLRKAAAKYKTKNDILIDMAENFVNALKENGYNVGKGYESFSVHKTPLGTFIYTINESIKRSV